MPHFHKKGLAVLAGAFLLAWVVLRYLLPLLMPFLLGAGLALAAEPLVRLLSRKLPRAGAAVIGVTLTLSLLASLLILLTALLIKELGLLARALPDLGSAARNGMNALEGFLTDLADRSPEGLRPVLSGAVSGLFRDGNGLFDRLLEQLPGAAAAVLSWIPDSALALGTGILSAFMVSVRLPKVKPLFQRLGSGGTVGKLLRTLRQIRSALGGWLKAQLRLMLLCFLIVGCGLLLLRVPYGLLWAFLITLVDAIPVLGTGTVLLPWSLVCFLQGQSVRAVGLLGVYAVAMLSRSVLEPRLVGKQLGLDPLITLIALYAGYQLWGIGGMLLSPVICVAVMEFTRAQTASE